MARHRRLHVLSKAQEIGLVPLFFHTDFETALGLSRACVEGGALLVEFTNRGAGALQVFREMEAWCAENLPQAILGVGSIVDSPTAAMFLDAGANFVVSPCMDEETAILCNKRKIPYMPGCGTVTEIHKAETLGVEVCKLFPGGEVGGPNFVKGVLAPRPWSSLMPTGGVSPTRDSLEPWIKAGITCAGMGSKLISSEIIKGKKYEELKLKVSETLTLIQEIRNQN
ncbi:MAG: bifunctional 4-hydroxy-2-oxoglutarate aldolase/2-dehydro-3-deoxy-phosphogluconate aldolase [Planctomycetes bacterium]|nr:bifunctional 4-hydroxy-2-oxoglutarate aldolase/2-dehydro-3-deoxy-phosphogluconate aldolase [Planctomycetota bacterium]